MPSSDVLYSWVQVYSSTITGNRTEPPYLYWAVAKLHKPSMMMKRFMLDPDLQVISVRVKGQYLYPDL